MRKLQSLLILELEPEALSFPGISSTRFLLEIWEISPNLFEYQITPECRFYFLREIGFPSVETALSAARNRMVAVTGGLWSPV